MFKKKKTSLTFHISGSQHVLDLFPPKYSLPDLIPDWYGSITKEPGARTLRHCPGFVDLLKNSIGIPLWADYEITHQNGQLKNASIAGLPAEEVPNMIQPHHPSQWGDAFPGCTQIKLISPWYITSNKKTQFMMHDAIWHKPVADDYQTLPGMLNFNVQHASHINMILPSSSEEKTIIIKAGTIIAYLTPITNEKIDIKTKWVSQERINSFILYNFSFSNNDYKKAMQLGEKLNAVR